jgi:hypothetical protein
MGDIPSWAAEASDDEDEQLPADPVKGGDIEMGAVKEEQPTYMTHFFGEVETIKSDIQAVKDASTKIEKLSEEAIHATTTEKEQALSQKLKPIVDKTNKRAKRTKNLLGLLKEETKKLKEEGTLKASDERYVAWSFIIVDRIPLCVHLTLCVS